MTTNEIVSAILSQFPGAAMVRKSKTNFIAIPMGENEDGVMEYASVKVGALLSKDTKSNTAFNFEASVAEHADYVAAQEAKAAAPKAPKKSGADPEKQAAMVKRQEAALAWLIENPGEHTATEIFKALPNVYEGKSVMTVGSDLKPLTDSVNCEKREGKNYWSFNG